jgi:purine nucleosidase
MNHQDADHAADRIPVILDVDTGIDDALALFYAAASPEVEFVAATCVPGNIDLVNVARNTAGVLALAGRKDVEVALGAERPLLRPLNIAPDTHGPRGLGYADPPASPRPFSERTAADLLVEEARRRPGQLLLVATGPLTNVALACLREPAFPALLRRLVIMGGAYGHGGNTTPVSEWNISVDPEAARLVFDAFSPDRLTAAGEQSPALAVPLCFGLDVTETAIMTPGHLERLWAIAGRGPDEDPLLGCIAGALRFYFEFHAKYDGFYGAHIHDPLTMAGAVHPELVLRTELQTVDVETAGALTTGQTVADRRHHWGRPPNAELVIEADVPAFLDRWIDRVGALARGQAAERERTGAEVPVVEHPAAG